MSRPRAPAKKKPPKTPEQEKAAARNRQTYLKNREKVLARVKAAYQLLTPAEIAEKRWRDAARPSGHKDKGHQRNAQAQAYYEWSDVEEVVRVHMAAAVMSELTGEDYEVDHAVPLRSPLVCGLHVHTNLGVIVRGENRFKGTWAWPDMWEYTWKDVEELVEMRKNV